MVVTRDPYGRSTSGFGFGRGVRPPTPVTPRSGVDTSSLSGVSSASRSPSAAPASAGMASITQALSPSQQMEQGLKALGGGVNNVYSQFLTRNLNQPEAAPVPTMGGLGGDGGAAARKAAKLRALTQFMESLFPQIAQQYGSFGDKLGEAEQRAAEMISAAGGRATEALSGIDPMAQFQYQVPPTAMPLAASAGYLQQIGANPADVAATQQLQQQLAMQALNAGQMFSQGESAAAARERQARLSAAQLAQQEAASGLGASGFAMRAQIAAAQKAEEDELRRQILEAQLQYGV
jgi:hypothetical protein